MSYFEPTFSQIDANNSTATPLGIAGVFTGLATDVLEFGTTSIAVFADQDSATDGISIEYSTDGANWDHSDNYTYVANTGKTYKVGRVAQYYRLVFTNGSVAQTAFRVQTINEAGYTKPSSHRVSDSILTDDDAELVKNVPMTEGDVANEFHNVSQSNPLPIKLVDSAQKESMNTVFGEQQIGTRIPTVSAQFQYGLPADAVEVTTANGGTAAYASSLLKLNTGTNAAGSVSIYTKDNLRYIAGHEAYFLGTAVFTSPVADSYQRGGIFDDDDGFFVGYEGVQFGVTHRNRGVATFYPIAIEDVFVDGSFNPTFGNIYKISFGYLGFATIFFQVMKPNGSWTELYTIEYPNSSMETHIGNTNLPARAEVGNTGNTTDIQFESGSISIGIVDGGGADPASRWFAFGSSTVAISGGTNQIITFRNKTTFNSMSNRIFGQLALVSAATDTSKITQWRIIKNATITNIPTWTDVNTADSIFEYSTDAVLTSSTGTDLLNWNMAKSDSFFQQLLDLFIGLRPGEWATVEVVAPGGTSGDIDISFRWKELF